MNSRERPVYLDHAATTPMLPAAVEAMTAQLGDAGNPSSLHTSGRAARRVVEESREAVAAGLQARPGEVVFTSGGTETNNLALKGMFWARRQAAPGRTRVITTAVEHHAVLDPLAWLESHDGAVVERLPVDQYARLDVAALRQAIARDPDSVALVSVMWANNEVGTLQPLREVVALADEHGIPVHADAVQAVGAVPVGFADSGLAALTVSGHKAGGPHGVGALLCQRDLQMDALVHGGGQERDVRSGTLDRPSIAGFAAAVESVVPGRPSAASRIEELRRTLVDGVRERVPEAVVNGHPEQRLPGIAHLTFPGCQGDSLLMLLDAQGVECSTGSACQAGVAQASHVLLAMGREEEAALGSLRFSLGHTSTAEDVQAVCEALGPAVERARAAGRRTA